MTRTFHSGRMNPLRGPSHCLWYCIRRRSSWNSPLFPSALLTEPIQHHSRLQWNQLQSPCIYRHLLLYCWRSCSNSTSVGTWLWNRQCKIEINLCKGYKPFNNILIIKFDSMERLVIKVEPFQMQRQNVREFGKLEPLMGIAFFIAGFTMVLIVSI